MVREVYLWPDNVEAWKCWIGVQTQWRSGFAGATGLDYAGVRAYLDEVQPEDRKAAFSGICACERAVLKVREEQREMER